MLANLQLKPLATLTDFTTVILRRQNHCRNYRNCK